MLIEFAAENYRSLRELTRFSMLATRGKELPDHLIKFKRGKINISTDKLAVFFGPNASGKSNILKALISMGLIVNALGITRENESDFQKEFYNPFILNVTGPTRPTLFQATYKIDSSCYRYGFRYDSENILEEWLFSGFDKPEKLIFKRKESKLDFGNFSKSKLKIFNDLNTHLTSTNLLLSIGADLKIDELATPANFFKNIYYPSYYPRSLADLITDPKFLLILSNLLAFADTGITKVEIHKEKVDWDKEYESMPENFKPIAKALADYRRKEGFTEEKWLNFGHSTVIDKENKYCTLHENEESRGTVAFLNIAIALCRALLSNSVIVIDEIDTSLHPLLLARALQFFTSVKGSEAQLLCSSHAPTIFSSKVLRRDELWLVEKDQNGGTFINNTSDFESARNDGDLAGRYLEGRFGGVPLFDNPYMDSAVNRIQELITENEREGNLEKKKGEQNAENTRTE